MKQLHVRHQTSVADPLRQERLRRALAIIMDYQEDPQARRTVRSCLYSQSTTGRNDNESGPLPPPLYTSPWMESVTDA
jgi:hypothetical protein